VSSLHVGFSNGLTPSIQFLTASHFISFPNLVRLTSFPGFTASHNANVDKLSSDVLEVLIGTLTRFFSFAVDFTPDIHGVNKTTHASSYTYWFLVLSAGILTKCSLSKEMQARHAYLLAVIATRLDEGNACDYLFSRHQSMPASFPGLQQCARRHLGAIFFAL